MMHLAVIALLLQVGQPRWAALQNIRLGGPVDDILAKGGVCRLGTPDASLSNARYLEQRPLPLLFHGALPAASSRAGIGAIRAAHPARHRRLHGVRSPRAPSGRRR